MMGRARLSVTMPEVQGSAVGVFIDVAPDRTEARRRAEQIRFLAASVADNLAKIRDLVHIAKESNDHEALGYPSWTAYLADLFGEEPLRLARDVRQELVAELSAQGMSTRAIAPIVGVTPMQVSRDVQAASGVTNVTPEPGEIEPVAAELDRAVTGLDGKTYTRPAEPPKPKRRPIADTARDAGIDLSRSVERVERVIGDDRFSRNRDDVARGMRAYIENAIESLTAALETLNTGEKA